MARRRGERAKVYVEISGGRKYGFQTQERIPNLYGKNLGMTKFAGASGVFFGANAPKPPRASFTDNTGTVSSFCSESVTSVLRKTEGWSITRNGRIRGVKSSGRTRTVFIEMPGNWKYAWNITAAEADLASLLGFELAQGSDASSLVWGVGDPKPPRATKKTAEGTTSTFIKPQASVIDRATADGWTVSAVNYDLLPEP
jgi:hypothetical protein